MITSFRSALAFLTRLPGGSHPDGPDQIARSVPYFPVVGALVGALGAAALVGGAELFSPSIGAVLCLAVTAAVTGGLHEDGLADSLDALAGGWDREQRMEIFKDSRHGTFGVLGLVLVALLKYSALISIETSLSRWVTVGVVVSTHALARSAAVVAMAILPSARVEGLGAAYGKTLPAAPTITAGLIGLGTVTAAFGLWMPLVVGVTMLSGSLVSIWAVKKIGGATGDVLGMVEQAGECSVLLTAVAVLA